MKLTPQPFPISGLLPKSETQATQFLTKYSSYDGRGVVVAILDTGVDPGAPGLSVTSDGKPKIVDIIDCTGSGDVLLSELKEADPDNFIVGASGRKLKLGSNWTNPTKKYRVGCKRAYDLFPKDLLKRLQSDRKEKFVIDHSKLMSDAQSQLLSWTNEHKESALLTEQELEVKSDLENRIAVLKDMMKNYEDYGVLLDCVTFHDGNTWRAALDLQETGDLSSCTLFADYKIERQYSRFNDDDWLNFSVKFYDEGEVLSIVTNAGSHGTHVAAICSAFFSEEPELNGVAPGAQIISLKIGDTRLGSMETGTGLSRALSAMINGGCTLANMSYGEDSSLCNSGFWMEMLRDEVINKRGIVFVSSAGNAGPALSTVGAPGGVCDGVISVGAYVTSDMIQAEYSLAEQVPENPFTWSSRGPTLDGDKGVTVYAPGAAITSVPQYQLKKGQLMNGTSMSSPNACGNIALLLSAFQQQAVEYSPYGIKRCIENTSLNIGDQFMVGLLQISDAYDYFIKYKSSELNIFYSIKTNNRRGGSRGILLREVYESLENRAVGVSVEAVFRKDDKTQNCNKLQLEQRLSLVSTQSWIKAPSHMLFNSGGRDFVINVNSALLAAGVHYGEVQALNSECIAKGPIFRIPVTVIKASPIIDSSFNFQQTYSAGTVNRQFVQVPVGATWAEMSMKITGKLDTPARLVVHLMQAIPNSRHSRTENHWYFNITASDPVVKKQFKVIEGLVLEVCTAQFWSSSGTHDVNFEFDFHGIQTDNQLLSLAGSDGYGRIDFSSILQTEKLKIGASLSVLRKSVSPSEAAIKPLKERDVLPTKQRLLELLLTYPIKVSESGEITFRKPLADDMLYESQFDSVLLMVLDSNKRIIQFGDVYPKAVKLEKGDYSVILQLRHVSNQVLEKLKTVCLLVDYKLPKNVDLDCYATLPDLIVEDKKPLKFDGFKLSAGEKACVFVSCIISQPKDAKYGDQLLGELKFFATSVELGQMSVKYIVAPLTAEKDSEQLDMKKLDQQAREDAVRDLNVAWLQKLTNKSDKLKLLDQLLKQYPTYLPLIVQQTELLVQEALTDHVNLLNVAPQSVKICDDALKSVDEVALFKQLNAKAPLSKTAGYKKTESDGKTKKTHVAQLRHRMIEALLIQATIGNNIVTQEKLELAWNDYWPYHEAKECKHVYVAVARERFYSRNGSALVLVNKFIDENKTVPSSKAFSFVGVFNQNFTAQQDDIKNMFQLRAELLKDLRWTVWSNNEAAAKLIRFPPNEMLF